MQGQQDTTVNSASGQEVNISQEQKDKLEKKKAYFRQFPWELKMSCIECRRSAFELAWDIGYVTLRNPKYIMCCDCLKKLAFGLVPEPRQKQEGARPGISRQLRWRVFARDNFTCVACGASGVPLECDHIVPVSQGGITEEDNLQALCEPCNRQKGDKSHDRAVD